jgi:hypothetical protein
MGVIENKESSESLEKSDEVELVSEAADDSGWRRGVGRDYWLEDRRIQWKRSEREMGSEGGWRRWEDGVGGGWGSVLSPDLRRAPMVTLNSAGPITAFDWDSLISFQFPVRG